MKDPTNRREANLIDAPTATIFGEWNFTTYMQVDASNVNRRRIMPILMFAAMWGAIFGIFSPPTERDAEDA